MTADVKGPDVLPRMDRPISGLQNKFSSAAWLSNMDEHLRRLTRRAELDSEQILTTAWSLATAGGP
jgi:hypothetical protein